MWGFRRRRRLRQDRRPDAHPALARGGEPRAVHALGRLRRGDARTDGGRLRLRREPAPVRAGGEGVLSAARAQGARRGGVRSGVEPSRAGPSGDGGRGREGVSLRHQRGGAGRASAQHFSGPRGRGGGRLVALPRRQSHRQRWGRPCHSALGRPEPGGFFQRIGVDGQGRGGLDGGRVKAHAQDYECAPGGYQQPGLQPGGRVPVCHGQRGPDRRAVGRAEDELAHASPQRPHGPGVPGGVAQLFRPGILLRGPAGQRLGPLPHWRGTVPGGRRGRTPRAPLHARGPHFQGVGFQLEPPGRLDRRKRQRGQRAPGVAYGGGNICG
mmetsp:Transcript_42171/g.82729  ORF Transcript_42171/g.82729 Transcript_42171/m.82729 type:complete len:325 (+) Transcript_42171:482-1456(+)